VLLSTQTHRGTVTASKPLLPRQTQGLTMLKPLNLIAIGIALGFSTLVNAGTIDLRADGATTTLNNGIYTAFDSSGSVGTGTFPATVKIGSNQNVVQGFNTDAAPSLDAGNAPNFTFLLADMARITRSGTEYVRFRLDINQSARNPDLSLDKVQIFLSNSNTLTGYSNCSLGGVSCVYDMDTGVNSSVLLTSSLNSGSGNGVDMYLDVATSLFGGANALTNYVYLYSQFGDSGTGFTNNGGFEEWSYQRCATTNGCADSGQVPLPASVWLLGAGILGLLGSQRKAQKS
jgi:hypothetical protein